MKVHERIASTRLPWRASIAQWQSTSLVSCWSRVRLPVEAQRPPERECSSLVGLMDKASASGAGDSRFESWAGRRGNAFFHCRLELVCESEAPLFDCWLEVCVVASGRVGNRREPPSRTEENENHWEIGFSRSLHYVHSGVFMSNICIFTVEIWSISSVGQSVGLISLRGL